MAISHPIKEKGRHAAALRILGALRTERTTRGVVVRLQHAIQPQIDADLTVEESRRCRRSAILFVAVSLLPATGREYWSAALCSGNCSRASEFSRSLGSPPTR